MSDPITEVSNNVDNINPDTGDIPELVAAGSDTAHIVQPDLQKSEFEFGDLLNIGRQMCGENIKFKLEFDSQIIDGSRVFARRASGEFLFSVRMRYRNFARVTDDQRSLVVPAYFTDLEKVEKLEIYVENNANDRNKVETIVETEAEKSTTEASE